MRVFLSVLAVQFLFVLEVDASTLLIDNFEEGPLSFFADGPQASQTQNGLSLQNVITGERTVVLQRQSSPTSLFTTAELSLTPGDDAIELTGDPDAVISGFRLQYAFSAPFDLKVSGTLNQFRGDILGASGRPEVRLNVIVGGTFFGTTAQFPAMEPGPLFFEVDHFRQLGGGAPVTLDLTQVDELRLIGQVYGSLSIANFAVVPEASVVSFLLIGLSVVGIRRRSRPSAGLGG